MPAEWLAPPSVTPPPEFVAEVGDALIAQLLYQRGIKDISIARAVLDPSLYIPASPFDLPDMRRAVERLISAHCQAERVLVWGDFDVDGQTATTLLVETFRSIGIDTRYYIPHRQTEGHGIHHERLAEIITRDHIQLVVTCDTGIASHRAVEMANDMGVNVIVTDHHQLPEILPSAHACVNPHRLPDTHPLYTLPGVGVAYELLLALAQYYPALSPESSLDLVALGVVADLAPLIGDTRYWLQRGLAVLRNTRRLGLQELCQRAQLDLLNADEQTIGFQLAPRLNALGRLSTADRAVELLMTSDLEVARRLSHEVESLNVQRKLQTGHILQSAISMLDRDPSLLDHKILVLSHPEWGNGVIGIVANDLAERYQRPVILFHAPPDEPARGSARSYGSIDVTALISSHSQLTLNYGGHIMAAGVTIEPARIPEFRRALSGELTRWFADGRVPQHTRTVTLSADVPLIHIDQTFIEKINRLSPFGSGNPAPVFRATGLTLVKSRALGRGGPHLKLTIADADQQMVEVFWWGGGGHPLPESPFDLAYRVRLSTYGGKIEPQIEWVDYHIPEGFEASVKRTLEVIDRRHPTVTVEVLRKLIATQSNSLCLWVEGSILPDDLPVRRRESLDPASILILWTIPPDRETLAHALKRVRPQIVYVFGVMPQLSTDSAALIRLVGGAIKYALKHTQGVIDLERLASLNATTERAVELCLFSWAQTLNYRIVIKEQSKKYCLDTSLPFSSKQPHPAELASRVQSELNEIYAFRQYFQRTSDLKNLFNLT